MAKAGKGRGRKAATGRTLVRFSARLFQDQIDTMEQYELEKGVTPTLFIRNALDAEIERLGLKEGKHGR